MAKEYIEREALWRAFEYESFYDNADRDEIVLPKIDAFPAADVVEVVRCAECQYFGTDLCALDTYLFEVTEDGFCSYGERRTDDGNEANL